jgi:aspartate-semialdehyde dehydrogenase
MAGIVGVTQNPREESITNPAAHGGSHLHAAEAFLYFGPMNAQNIAIVGATGAVGVEILRVLERRNFPAASLKLLASARSAGKTLEFKGKPYTVEEVKASSFKGVDIAFFSAGATRSREFVPHAKAAGAIVIDNSSAFRMDPNVPLVVPEVNPGDLRNHNGVIANPNCCAAILAAAVWPIHLAAGIRKIVVSTYQSASGAGAAAMRELEDQVHQYADGKQVTHQVFPHQIAFNLFSHDTKVAENGYNEEENKLIAEMRKMFHMPDLAVVPTCIRVPVLRAHSEAVTLDLDRPLSLQEARTIFANAPGIKLVDDPAANHFPMPLEASGDLDIHVGRIRSDLSNPNGLVLFVAGDQLLKGAAWNAVQIAEELAKPVRAAQAAE